MGRYLKSTDTSDLYGDLTVESTKISIWVLEPVPKRYRNGPGTSRFRAPIWCLTNSTFQLPPHSPPFHFSLVLEKPSSLQLVLLPRAPVIHALIDHAYLCVQAKGRRRGASGETPAKTSGARV